jgi:hypothetical protein
LLVVCVAVQVAYDGEFPLDGAKVVETAMMRTVSRVMRQAQAQPGCKAKHGCTVKLALDGQGLTALVSNNTAPVVQQKQKPKPKKQQQQQPKQQQPAHQHHPRRPSTEEL